MRAIMTALLALSCQGAFADNGIEEKVRASLNAIEKSTNMQCVLRDNNTGEWFFPLNTSVTIYKAKCSSQEGDHAHVRIKTVSKADGIYKIKKVEISFDN